MLADHISSPVDDAIRRAVAFLEKTQLPDGEVPLLVSDQPDHSLFPTALAAYSLAFVPEAAAVRARALDFLEREMEPRGVWQHRARSHPAHDGLVADADDTACAAAALRLAGRAVPDVATILLANRTRDGRFRTWLPTFADLRKPRALWDLFVRGTASISDVDAVVNANVLHFVGAARCEAVVEWLLTILREDRETDCDKWYDNPFGVWYFFSRALVPTFGEASEIITRKVRAAVPQTALEYALRISTLANCGVAATVTELLELQTERGSWPSASLYNVGRVRRRDGTFVPGTGDWMTFRSEELTTAFALEALGRHRAGRT
jgi:hypothetical protein